MTLHTYPDVEQRSDQWYALRCGIVTASTVGKLLTPTLKVADNDVSRGLTAQLVAERITGEVDPTFTSDDMWRGIEHEPHAIAAYVQHHAAAVETTGFMVREEPGWKLGYSPDGLVGADGLVEVKCPRAKTHLRTILADEVPAYHMAQLQAGLLVTGRKWIDFISFCAGMPLYVKRVLPDPGWHEAIEVAVRLYEKRADVWISDYEQATKNLPATERVADLEIVI